MISIGTVLGIFFIVAACVLAPFAIEYWLTDESESRHLPHN